MLDRIRLKIATILVSIAASIVNKKTLEGFGLVVTLKDWVDYCELRRTELKNKG